MGEVYRARDERIGRDVAVKVLPPEFTSDPDRLRRFEQEARAAGQLSHPNILAVYDVGTHEGSPYIVTEILEGKTLREQLTEGGLTVRKAVGTAVQIAQGLSAAHEKGIVHRDLKPANVFVTRDGHVKILDFGIAKLTRPEAGTGPFARTLEGAPLTDSGAVLGTMGYISPEQLRGQPADARSDIFSFGCVLYEMLSTRSPFLKGTGAETVSAILNEDPRPLSASGREVPPALQEIVHRCLEKRPEDRFSSAHDLALALRAISGSADTPAAVAAGYAARGGLPRRLRWPVPAAALAVVVAALAFLDVGGVRSRLLGRGGGPERTIKLAVLPFVNLTGDPEQEYLSDGLTQEMIAQLGRLHPETLSVIARTSVMRYKKTNTPIDQIGRELGVSYVLEGSAQREGGRVQITAELVKVRDQTQLWAESYERELSGVLALQRDVARKVAGSLAIKLLPAEQSRLASVREVNPEAYDLYLKGSHYWITLLPGDLDTAQRFFNLALEQDPGFARAYAGISMVWACRQQMGFARPGEAGPKAKAAALRAFELDDTVADAHVALATVQTYTDWDFAAAGLEWRRAIELNPSDSEARAFYSNFLMHVGKPDEAMAQVERALKGDPFNVIIQTFYAMDLVYVGRYGEALAAAREALRMQPGTPAALGAVFYAASGAGKQKEAFDAAKVYLASVYQDRQVERACDEGFATGGYAEGMKRGADALATRFQTSYALPFDIACLYLEAGEKARALDWLEKGFEVRDPSMPYIGMSYFGALRSELRFRNLLRRMGLPAAGKE